MTTEQQSLLPFDETYVLMHKRTLLVNAAVTNGLVEYIAKEKGLDPDFVAAGFGATAASYFQEMPEEEVSSRASLVVANCWKANKTKLVITTDCTPPDEAV
jgi:hypothetical protein